MVILIDTENIFEKYLYSIGLKLVSENQEYKVFFSLS